MKILDAAGKFLELEERADTMAAYFEQVQWQVKFPDLFPESSAPIPNGVDVSIVAFSLEELTRILKKLKQGKASGHDNIPPEFWKFVVGDPHAMSKLLDLCNHCWETTDIPNTWRVAKVVLLFKKGDATLPQNYRPI